MSNRPINELERIEFTGSLGAAFQQYADEGRRISRRLAFELEAAAGDSQAAMERLHGHPLMFGLDCKIRARRVAKRLKRAQELAAGMGTEVSEFQRAYRKHFLTQ